MTDMTPEELKEALELAETYARYDEFDGGETMNALATVSRALLYYLKPKPIAEADKSQRILGVEPKYSDYASVDFSGVWDATIEGGSIDPTHFYPLPPAPEGE